MINILAIAPAARRVRYQIKAVNSIEMRTWYKDRELAKPFSRFCELCRSLAADGFSYQVRIVPEPDGLLSLEMTGTAGRAKPSKAPRRARFSPPAGANEPAMGKENGESCKRYDGLYYCLKAVRRSSGLF